MHTKYESIAHMKIAFVLAGDRTSHEKINYEALSVFLRTPDYSAEGPRDQTVCSCRFLGVCKIPTRAH